MHRRERSAKGYRLRATRRAVEFKAELDISEYNNRITHIDTPLKNEIHQDIIEFEPIYYRLWRLAIVRYKYINKNCNFYTENPDFQHIKRMNACVFI